MNNFILDTSAILDNPNIISELKGNIIIPFVVVLELEKNKTREGETGANGRSAIRYLNELRRTGSFKTGITTANGSTVTVKDSPKGTEGFLNDDIIIKVAKGTSRGKKQNTFLLTNDLAMKIKANCDGVQIQEVVEKAGQDEVYSGEVTLDVDKKTIDSFYKDGNVKLTQELSKDLNPNEFVCLKNGKQHSALGRVLKSENNELYINAIKADKENIVVCGISAKNKEQDYALELLMDKNIHLMSMCGKAGAGKTFLALAAAFEQTVEKKIYDRVIVMRPTVAVGNDIGYLPGTKEEKLSPWIQPIKDNLEVLVGGDKKNVDMLFEHGTFQIEALTYIRGRSIPKSFIIIDEAQNLTPMEIKTIITRSGIGSKIILTGDIEQIDIPRMDVRSNGLSKVIEKFKGYTIAGHVTLQKGQRSPLATLAADIL